MKSEKQIQLQTRKSRSQWYGRVNFPTMERDLCKKFADMEKEVKEVVV